MKKEIEKKNEERKEIVIDIFAFDNFQFGKFHNEFNRAFNVYILC